MRLMERGDADNPPKWLTCKKALIPDMIAKNPEDMPVWEITGAEFSKSDVHTADGISIRFPRITKQRDDKSYKEATNVKELTHLYEESKGGANLHMLTDGLDETDDIEIKTKIQNFNKPSPSKSPMKSKRKSSETDKDSDSSNKTTDNKKRKMVEADEKTIEQNQKSKELQSSSSAEEKKVKTIKTDDDKKRQLKYNNSSDDEAYLEDKTVNEASTASLTLKTKVEKKPKIPEMFSSVATKKQKFSNDTAGSADDNNKIKPKASDEKKQTNDITDNANVENNSKEISGNVAKNSDINIFEGVLLYVPTEVRDYVKEELRYFVLWGGTELNFAKKCTHVLHKNTEVTDDLKILRYIIFSFF